jgi:hypothetical protein
MLLIGWGELTLVELALVSSPTVVPIDMGDACMGDSTHTAYRLNYRKMLYRNGVIKWTVCESPASSRLTAQSAKCILP